MDKRSTPEIDVSVAVVMLFVVSALTVRSFVETKMVESGIDSVHAKQLSQLLSFALLAILMWPILVRIWPAIAIQFATPHSWFRLVIASIALGLVLRIAFWGELVARVSFGWAEIVDPDQAVAPTIWFSCPAPETIVLSIFVMALVTPIVEEVVHRGVILHSLIPIGKWTAIVVSALLFAVMHSFQSIPAAFIGGMFFAVQALNTGGLWGPVITHATYNLLTFVDWNCMNIIWKPAEVTDSMQVAGSIALVVSIVSLFIGVRLVAALKIGAVGPPRS